MTEQVFHDSEGVTPEEGNLGGVKIGALFFHVGKRKLYRTVGVSFDAERDRWQVQYRAAHEDPKKGVSGPTFTHLPEDFNRHERFLEVDQ